MEFKDLVKRVLRYNKNTNVDLLWKAYQFSSHTLGDAIRPSGEKWIEHYLQVASLAVDLKLDDVCIATSLMHGIIKRGNVTKGKLKNEFGDEITSILEGIDKLNKIKDSVKSKNYKNEDLRKVLLATSKDIRIILIKLCDKVVNMRELNHFSREEQKRISQEVMDLYVPLAYRLGIGKIKSELEDLYLKYLYPKIYYEISKKIEENMKDGNTLIYKIKRFLSKKIEEENIKFEIYGRVKSINSIYRKLKDRTYKLGNMYDLIALRILTKTVDDCYRVLRIVHSNFRPIQGSFKDYIAFPKPNGYQSLHTSVFDSANNILEFQIRTEEMHSLAEEGVASHFEYKGFIKDKDFDKRLGWMKQLVLDKSSNKLDIELFSDHIFVFTPEGKMVELPHDSTPIDFAYQVHSDIGDKCAGAIVNGKIVPFKT